MDLRQRVLRRSPLVVWTLNGLLGVSSLLFLHAMVRQNLSGAALTHWPWSWQLLDAQSATAALMAATGAIVARAQFARTVQPLLGVSAWTAAGQAPGGVLSWTCYLRNEGHGSLVVRSIDYRVDFTATADSPATSTGWTTRDAVVEAAAERGLRSGTDYRLTSMRPNGVLGSESRFMLAWFAETGLAVIADAYVRITVQDRLGDLHGRAISCLIDADRELSHPMTDLT
ncbi:hypothetical protein ACIQBJ_14450 [Kitasatospora sp. NPDC088391]|uniref:hypothetical protein n=1 Tax=Kitasatospora sp. NPDC088391 TaxID=3364074 RepID=UPI00381DC736